MFTVPLAIWLLLVGRVERPPPYMTTRGARNTSNLMPWNAPAAPSRALPHWASSGASPQWGFEAKIPPRGSFSLSLPSPLSMVDAG